MSTGIFKKNLSCLVFKFVNPETDLPVTVAEFEAAAELRKFTALDPSSTFDFNHGVVSALEIDGEHSPSDLENGYTVLGYRFDRKKVPLSAVAIDAKKRVASLKAKLEAETKPGDKKRHVSRDEIKGIVASAKEGLLSKIPYTSKHCGVIYSAETGLLFITGASQKEAEAIVAAICSAMQIAPAQVAPTNPVDYALQNHPKLNGAESVTQYLDALDEAGMSEQQAFAEFMTFSWFASETVTSVPQFKAAISTASSTEGFNANMIANTVSVGKIDAAGKIGDSMSSMENDHGHIRYKMWGDGAPVVSCEFQLTHIETGDVLACVRLDASKTGHIGIRTCAFFSNKENTRALNSSDPADVAASVELFVDNVTSAYSMLADMAGVYIMARLSGPRWKSVQSRIREWLEAYAPECERDLKKIAEKQ